MARFEIAYGITAENEGGYTLDPHETWRGIDRHEQPGWRGWVIVDQIKAADPPSLNHALADASDLQGMVLSFYRVNFWDAVRGDNINSQAVANKLYDAGVNMGTYPAIRLMQQAIGVNPDDIIGSHTLAVINTMAEADVLAKFKAIRVDHYKRIVDAHPEDAKYLDSWLSRC